jgi:hypothetical protein
LYFLLQSAMTPGSFGRVLEQLDDARGIIDEQEAAIQRLCDENRVLDARLASETRANFTTSATLTTLQQSLAATQEVR